MWINVNITKFIFVFLTFVFSTWLFMFLVNLYYNDPTYEVKYDCRQASIRLDYPIEVKDKCKKVMKKYEQNIQQNSQ
jgi:hypothetical protein